MKSIKKYTLGTTWAIISLIVTASIGIAVLYAYMYLRLPSVTVLKDIRLQEPLRIFTRDGKLIAEYGEKKRIPVTLGDVPQPLLDAILATEDRRFYEHPGIDFIGLGRAAVSLASTGEKTQGASTITMQVARNFFLTRKKTFDRKIKEILLAIKIDHTLSKDKILELYVNKIYFGNRAYGVAAAAHVYYGKELKDLTLPEMATIAGLPRSPSRDNPLRNPEKSIDRRNHVLGRMLDAKMIDQKTYEEAIKAPVTARYHPVTVEVSAGYVGEMVRKAMIDEFGEMAYIRGFDVYTTIDSKLQIAANESLTKGLVDYDKRHGYRAPEKNLGKPTPENIKKWPDELKSIPSLQKMEPAVVIKASQDSVTAILKTAEKITIPYKGLTWTHGRRPKAGDLIRTKLIKDKQGKEYWSLAQVPGIQGALVAVDSNDGGILALNGGFSFQQSVYNRVTQSERQPGSAFKPFIFAAALTKGYTLATLVNDAPIVISTYGTPNWRPQNYNKTFLGRMRLRPALVKSRNTIPIRLVQDFGVHHAVHFLTRFGFGRHQLPASPSLALGSGATTPLQMAIGYSVFANGGFKVSPYFISQVFEDNKLVYKAKPPTVCNQCVDRPENLAPRIIEAENAYMINDVLKGVIQYGTGRKAKVLGRKDIGGKTGTTNEYVDAWFAGFNRDITTVAWLGFDNPRPTEEYSSQVALPVWTNFMRDALDGKPENHLPRPSNIVVMSIDRSTGRVVGPGHPNAVLEMFKKDSVPKQKVSYLRGDEEYDDEYSSHVNTYDSFDNPLDEDNPMSELF